MSMGAGKRAADEVTGPDGTSWLLLCLMRGLGLIQCFVLLEIQNLGCSALPEVGIVQLQGEL